MKSIKKLTLAALSASMVAGISACSSSPTTSNPLITAGFNANANFRSTAVGASTVKVVNEADGQHIYADVGNGKKTSTTLSFKLDLGSGISGFATKSADGVLGAATSVKGVGVWLFEALPGDVSTAAAGSNLASLAVVPSYTATSQFSFPKTVVSGGTATITFTNVPANAGTPALNPKAYFIAAAAGDAAPTAITNASDIGNNLTNYTTNTMRYTIGTDKVILNNSGTFARVSATNKVFSDLTEATSFTGLGSDLAINLTLADEVGATITGVATITDGTTGIPPIAGVGG